MASVMESKTTEGGVRVSVWHQNIDTVASRKTSVLRHLLPKATIEERMKGVLETIGKHKPDVIALQELRSCSNMFGETIDTVTPIVTGLQKLGYVGNVASYRGDDEKAFKYCIAVRRDGPVEFAEYPEYTRQTYMSLTPDSPTPDDLDIEARLERNHGVKFERCFVSERLVVRSSGERFILVSAHLPIVQKARDAALAMLLRFIQRERRVNKCPVIAVGDFNTIPDLGGKESIGMIDSLCRGPDAPLIRLPIRADPSLGTFPGPKDDIAQRTFIAMPNDFLMKQKDVTESPEWREMEEAVDAADTSGTALSDGAVTRFREMIAAKWLDANAPEFLTNVMDHIIVTRDEHLTVEKDCAFAPESAFASTDTVRDAMREAIMNGRLPPAYTSDHVPMTFSFTISHRPRTPLMGLMIDRQTTF